MSRKNDLRDPEFKTRFLLKVLVIEDENSCWEWQANRIVPSGYGRVSIDGLMELAHRVSYVLYKGIIPEGLNVLHTCDNPPCVRPSHLYAGTNSQNIEDSISRGRWGRRDNAWAREYSRCLTPEQESELISMYSTGKYSQRSLGSIFGISHNYVGMYVRGEIKPR